MTGLIESGTLYESQVVLNPKSVWQMFWPNARLAVRSDGVWFDKSPGLIPYGAIHGIMVKRGNFGVIDHPDGPTSFQLTGPNSLQLASVVKLIKDLTEGRFEGMSTERLKKQTSGLQNSWVFFAVMAVPLLSGGAIGGASGAIFGGWVQMLINKKPDMPVGAKIGLVVVGIIGAFMLYVVGVMILAALFPGLFRR